MTKAILIALLTSACITDGEEIPSCVELGCEFALCQPSGACSCKPDPESEPMVCLRDLDDSED